MIAQIFLSVLLLLVLLFAWSSVRKTPQIGSLAAIAALAGLYFVWLPDHATWIAVRVGVGRGVDLVLYVWVIVSLLAILYLHLQLRAQLELITKLARVLALKQAEQQQIVTQADAQ